MKASSLITGTSLMVLISTYWNVNDTGDLRNNCSAEVLISTYWNVNLDFLNQ